MRKRSPLFHSVASLAVAALWMPFAEAAPVPKAAPVAMAPPVVQVPPSLRNRSVSSSRQFIVYCADVGMRIAVTGHVETLKGHVLRELGLGDRWQFPIVISMTPPATTDPTRPLCEVRLVNTDDGSRIEINLTLREEQLREVRFPQQVIRAILLEIAYRGQPPADGTRYIEPPAWMIEGLAEHFHALNATSQPNAALFRQLIETGKLPAITDFIMSDLFVMDSTSRAIYAECAYSLFEMLSGLPQGQESLVQLLRDLPRCEGRQVALLLRSFPSLGGSEAALEKWWTLGLARFSAMDRYAALSVTETAAALAPLLELEIATDAAGKERRRFTLDQYREFLRYPTARPALQTRLASLLQLGSRAHPLLRPVLQEYQSVITRLLNRRFKGVDQTLEAMGRYQALVVERTGQITDYLNWYEATQIPERSGAFESYLKAARHLQQEPAPKRYDALSQYIDQVQREFE